MEEKFDRSFFINDKIKISKLHLPERVKEMIKVYCKIVDAENVKKCHNAQFNLSMYLTNLRISNLISLEDFKTLSKKICFCYTL